MNRKYKYCFKTRYEFDDEYGNNWKSNVGWNDENHMDYLLGTYVDVPQDCIDRNGNIIKKFRVYDSGEGNFTGWTINKKMIKNVLIIPNYKPRTFIYE